MPDDDPPVYVPPTKPKTSSVRTRPRKQIKTPRTGQPAKPRYERTIEPAAPEIATVTSISKPRRRPDGRSVGGPAPQSEAGLTVRKRRERATMYKALGFNGPQTADRMRAELPELPEAYDANDVYRDVAIYMAEIHVEIAADYLDHELHVLRVLQQNTMAITLDRNNDPDTRLAGARTMLQIIDKRAKLVGGYAPDRHIFLDAAGNPMLDEADSDPRVIEAEAIRVLNEILPPQPTPPNEQEQA